MKIKKLLQGGEKNKKFSKGNEFCLQSIRCCRPAKIEKYASLTSQFYFSSFHVKWYFPAQNYVKLNTDSCSKEILKYVAEEEL